MTIIEGIGAEVLPLGKFGRYLRDHFASRTEQYAWDVVREAVKHFNPHMPEDEVRAWFDARRRDEKRHWEEKLLPAIKRSLQEDADYYAAQHAAHHQHEEEE